MYTLFTGGQSAQIDLILTRNKSVSGYELMRRAAQACMDQISLRWDCFGSALVFAGVGNNGGDGYEIGRLLVEAGCDVGIIEVFGIPKKGDAVKMRQLCLDAGAEIVTIDSLETFNADLIVDAIFGIGLGRPLSKELVALLEKVNNADIPVLAVDIPSGLNADTGCAMPCAVKADVTVTFITHKRGLYTGDAKDFCGEIVYADLGVGFDTEIQIAPDAWLFDSRDVERLPSRRHNSHKGDYGHVLIVGGDFGMAGAMRLAGEAAMACGAGLVSIATRPEHASALAAACPVLMAYGVTAAADLNKLLESADTIIVGPGLGTGEWGQALFEQVMQSPQPKLIDASALILLAERLTESAWDLERCVLTPHPGEAARLLRSSAREVQLDRFSASREIAARFGGVCVLKGSGTVICSKVRTLVCADGNPAMATAGMGDVLSGMIGALMAQGQIPEVAAKNAVGWHACVGDEAMENGPFVLLASDMFDRLRWSVGRTKL